jgi:hypothetical protein
LKVEEAMKTLQGLQSVTFSYKVSPEENHVGFVAEDVPDLVATKDRKGLSPMDIVAVLTKVVQEQHRTINEQGKVAEEHQRIIQEQQKTINQFIIRLSELEKESRLRSIRANADLPDLPR